MVQDKEITRDFSIESLEMKRVKRLIKFMPEHHQPIAQSIFLQLVFIDNTLLELNGLVEKNGTIETFTQGAQSMLREAPALASYNKTLQRYNQTMKQFIDLLPVSNSKPEKDALLDFIGAK